MDVFVILFGFKYFRLFFYIGVCFILVYLMVIGLICLRRERRGKRKEKKGEWMGKRKAYVFL